ncbi:flagellar basal body P-ring protein FlgI [Porticoccus sp.]
MSLSAIFLKPARLAALWLMLAILCAPTVQAERLAELSDFVGVRDNPLLGYGLVIGLDGSGDQTMQAPFTGQSLTNMLSQLGITVPPGTNMQLRNIAAVIVTAQLPPFASPGQQFDVVVSSVGNARSLRGGTLLMTPLKGADGQVYAIAQGNLLVGGVGAESGGSSAQINHQSAGRISGGAIVERQVATRLGTEAGLIELQLKRADFTVAREVVAAINREFSQPLAAAQDGRVIRIQGPLDSNAQVNFMARVENLYINMPDAAAKVVINSRTGSVVLNRRVSLFPAAVSHGNLSVIIESRPQVSQSAPFGQGDTVVVPNSRVTIEQERGSLQTVEGADLSEVVNALNALGATPQDLMSILEALKVVGSLRAELEII